MKNKVYNLRELFDFKEGTIFTTNFGNDDSSEFEVWVEDGILCFEDEECKYDGDNKCNITKKWLEGTFKLKE